MTKILDIPVFVFLMGLSSLCYSDGDYQIPEHAYYLDLNHENDEVKVHETFPFSNVVCHSDENGESLNYCFMTDDHGVSELSTEDALKLACRTCYEVANHVGSMIGKQVQEVVKGDDKYTFRLALSSQSSEIANALMKYEKSQLSRLLSHEEAKQTIESHSFNDFLNNDYGAQE